MLGEVVIHLRQVSLTNTSEGFCSAFVSQSANSKILSPAILLLVAVEYNQAVPAGQGKRLN